MGSDSGCWPALPGVFHGVSSIREIELLGAAGLPASAVIMAATKTAAEMMGIDREVGTIEVGKQADLIVVRGDPLSDLTLLRSIEWTVKAGVMRTPKEWMALTHGASQ